MPQAIPAETDSSEQGCTGAAGAVSAGEASIVLTPRQANDLKQVIKHVEYYQPLYGLKIHTPPLRVCRDRAEVIADALAPLGPNMRLIDFGSSLGYFVFYFADRGARAEGVDHVLHNVAVAETVRRINGIACTFRFSKLTREHVARIPAGKYDVGLILSVLHHIIHERGIEYVSEMVAQLLQRIPVLVLELASGSEPVNCAWRASQPQDPLEILSACGEVHVRKLGEFDSHLSTAKRGLWLVSSNGACV